MFRGDSINLDIPKKGKNVEGGWKLKPATPQTVSHRIISLFCSRKVSTFMLESFLDTLPQIKKKEVDSHRPKSKTVPHCELLAKWMKDQSQAKSLLHTVNILGTAEEQFFTISIDPSKNNMIF